MSARLPDSIALLLRTRIDSLAKLELVTALHAAPRQTLSVDVASARLRMSKELVRNTVAALHSVSVATLSLAGEIQLLLPTESDRQSVAELSALYDHDRQLLVRALRDMPMKPTE